MEDFVTFDFRSVPDNLNTGFTYVFNVMKTKYPGLTERLDWVLFNMSNSRVQKDWLAKMEISPDKSYFNQEKVGNCGAASLGLLLGDFVKTKKPDRGQVALLMSVGTGLQFGGAFYCF
jgi:3-oxoacyl-[acyl-carrier-protein] synthase III